MTHKVILCPRYINNVAVWKLSLVFLVTLVYYPYLVIVTLVVFSDFRLQLYGIKFFKRDNVLGKLAVHIIRIDYLEREKPVNKKLLHIMPRVI